LASNSATSDRVDVHIIDRPNQPILGSGETAQGPTAAAIGNAVARAIGVRLRDLPLSHERIRAAVSVKRLRRLTPNRRAILTPVWREVSSR